MLVQLKGTKWKDHLSTAGSTIGKPPRGKKFKQKFCQEIQFKLFPLDWLPYGKAPSLNIYNSVLVCTKNFEWLLCWDYSVCYRTVVLMYSRLYLIKPLHCTYCMLSVVQKPL